MNLNKGQDIEKLEPNLPDASIIYYPKFLDERTANEYFNLFLKELNWEQHYIKIFGKTVPQPRLTALYAENTDAYTYSGLTLTPGQFTAELQMLQKKLKTVTGTHFTHCLANLYRDGNDSMGLHSDDEKVLGENPVIASLSFGAARKFRLKHKTMNSKKFELELEHGSLLLMAGTTQHFWKHELPKSLKVQSPRINLTYRSLS